MNQSEIWLDTAVAGIRFGPDRAAVREEFSAHLEDKAADFQRLFPEMTPEEAEERALAEMGDPEEIGKTLAEIHRPWLGWLWTASKWLRRGLLTALLLFCLLRNDYFASHGFPPWGEMGRVNGPVDGPRAELGGYTFQVVGAAFLEAEGHSSYMEGLQVTVRVFSPKFWARMPSAALERTLTAVTPDGTRLPMDRAVVVTGPAGEQRIQAGLSVPRWGLFWRDISVWIPAESWTPGERVELEFSFAQGSFVLPAEITERVVIG